MTRTPDERTTQTASQAPAPGGEIISESGGAIKSEQRGGFVGIGIDPKDVTRIFGMFQRLHGEREYPGLGIGLALCEQIVRGHGGDLIVESTPGRGACFIIEFRGPGLRAVTAQDPRYGAPQR